MGTSWIIIIPLKSAEQMSTSLCSFIPSGLKAIVAFQSTCTCVVASGECFLFQFGPYETKVHPQ